MRRKYVPIVMLLAAAAAVFAFSMPRARNPAAPRPIEQALPVPPTILETLHRACYNCHSNETEWPWYSRLPIAGAMIHRDVEHARSVMNFSDWHPRDRALLPAACAAIQSGEMPKWPYPLIHPEARLSDRQKQQLCEWVRQLEQ